MTPPVSQACGCWGSMRGVWHHQDRRRRGPRELTGIVDLKRGKDHPTARLSGPGPGKVWHRVQELARRAWRRLPLRYPDRDTGSLPGTARTPSMTSSKTPPASSMPFTSSSSLATPQVRCVAASSKTPWVTADARVTPSIKSAIFCAPHTRRLTPRQQERLREAFTADEAHISVEVAYHCAQQVRDVFHQDTPTQGRRLAAHLIETLPTCPIPEIARLGANPTQVEGRTRRLLRYRRSQQRLHGSHQRTLSSWADAPPEATATPPATNSECSSSQEA